ncbi:MAG: restriction endonuclease subunit S [Candidatus Hydrogenedentes bacterium]|nr:restriction endonuclease subunit S [Candidatus Hydrogenedentota bacterium]
MTQTHEHNAPVLRFPEFSGEWKSLKISEMANVVTGNTPDTSRQDYYGGDIPFYSPADIPEAGGIVSKSKKTLTEAG